MFILIGMYHVREKYYMRSDIDKHTHRRTGSLPYLWQYTKWTDYIYYCAYFPSTYVVASYVHSYIHLN